MSDHDAPDPIDKAYAQAEAMLDDEAARAARRARVLGAVTSDAQAASRSPMPPKRRVSWAAGGWLAAASVAGVSVLVALELTRPPVMRRPSPPAEAPVAADQTKPQAAAPVTAPAVKAAPPAPPAVSQGPESPAADIAVAPPSAFPAPQNKAAVAPVAAPPPPPSAAAAPQAPADALVVTGQGAPPPAMGRMESARAPTAQTSAAAPLAVRPASLHAAAAAGRLAELTSLLAQGTPVDALDSDGETPLMKAIQANRPAAAALLLRHGANLDRTNRGGVSARDMAIAIDDPALNRALGLEP